MPRVTLPVSPANQNAPREDHEEGVPRTAAGRVAVQQQSAHRDLHAQFAHIESALNSGELQRGAHLLSDLIDQARAHFINEEAITLSAGLTPGDGERLLHDVFMERARKLKARCLNSPANSDFKRAVESELVVLLSDLVESDLRVAHRVDVTTRGDS